MNTGKQPTIVIAGDNGFIGTVLASHFENLRYTICLLTRGKTCGENGVRHVHWDGRTPTGWERELEGVRHEDAGVLGSQLSFHLRNDGCIFFNQSSRLDLFGDQSNNGLHSLLVLVPEHFHTFGNYHVKVYDRRLRVVSHSR